MQRRARMGVFASERGVAAVEFAIVALLFFQILFGIVTFGVIFALDNSVTHAAAEGARIAISKPTADEQIAVARQTALARLPGWIRDRMDPNGDGEPDPPAEITATIAPCASATEQDCIHVTISYPWKEKPLVTPMPGFGLVAPDRITAEAEVGVG